MFQKRQGEWIHFGFPRNSGKPPAAWDSRAAVALAHILSVAGALRVILRPDYFSQT
jgi:hypothetical protein